MKFFNSTDICCKEEARERKLTQAVKQTATPFFSAAAFGK
jgi:hypothetical protein